MPLAQRIETRAPLDETCGPLVPDDMAMAERAMLMDARDDAPPAPLIGGIAFAVACSGAAILAGVCLAVGLAVVR